MEWSKVFKAFDWSRKTERKRHFYRYPCLSEQNLAIPVPMAFAKAILAFRYNREKRNSSQTIVSAIDTLEVGCR